MTSACQHQLNAEFSKECEHFKVHGIESLNMSENFYRAVIVATFPRPKHDVEQNEM